MLGPATPDGFRLDYRFPDAVYVDRFVRAAASRTWTITEQAAGKPDKLFARPELCPTRCRGMTFGF